MPKLPLVKVVYRLVQTTQKIESLRGDARLDNAAIVGLAFSSDKAPFFHPVEQARHVRIMRNHAIADVAARQAVRLSTAQDPQDVILRTGQAVGFQELFRLLAQGIGGFLEGNKGLILKREGDS